ncbi:hypothetical protein [Salinimicrobium soli]|uniref:hypothetical protein n=1 Tax=Salinimicrobium soli TaxID=1254399 RepID=UPI003AB09074
MKKILPILAFLALAGCSTENVNDEISLDAKGNLNSQNVSQDAFDVPSLACGESTTNSIPFEVIAGPSGAAGGFDLDWQLVANETDPVSWDDTFCEKGFASNNNNSYALASNGKYPLLLEELIVENECGTPLACGMTYAFRVRAKNEGGGLKKSEWSPTFFCSTAPCETACESGYMIGNKDFSEIGTSKNWGWAHEFDFNEVSGSEEREIHHKNGGLGGFVTISWNSEDQSITVEEGNNVTITHLYVSDNEPMDKNAPGDFDKTQTLEDSDGHFWVMVKAEVCN